MSPLKGANLENKFGVGGVNVKKRDMSASLILENKGVKVDIWISYAVMLYNLIIVFSSIIDIDVG